ncbi:MFS transporter [Nonomuraea sp. NPDC050663]|uniref:MFS transporter n=1 Tax=Nonomuraea sp. NPDC050663 TaxID=3364370 RepID=UPI00378AB44C
MRMPHLAPLLGFAGFGAFWGVWGATLPLLRAQAGVSDTEFGLALLFVAAGALPAMLATGHLVDRLGLRVAGVLLALLGVSGVVLAFAPGDLVTLCAGILLVGAASGAADVAINTLAATVEKRTGRPVVSRSHAAFSAAVALSSLGAGALAGLAGSLPVNFGAAAVIAVALGSAVVVSTRSIPAPGREPAVPPRAGRRVVWWAVPLLIGAIGALAFASENAYQSWGAVLLTDSFAASPLLASAAPALFATTAAVLRFAAAPLTLSRPIATLVGGSVIATAGGVVTASAATLPLALAGIVLAAAGTSILFPTLLSYGLRGVPDGSRGRAASVISTAAYVGFLGGPAYFGMLADAFGVQRAFLGVAALTVVLLAALPATRRRRPGDTPDGSHERGAGGRSGEPQPTR